MAIEFGSRRETFENYKVYETMLAGRPFKVEMGKMCGLSNASALIRYGETCVMCNVVMSPKPREGVDFFPLNVEYEEKLYAAGRIPGSFCLVSATFSTKKVSMKSRSFRVCNLFSSFLASSP